MGLKKIIGHFLENNPFIRYLRPSVREKQREESTEYTGMIYWLSQESGTIGRDQLTRIKEIIDKIDSEIAEDKISYELKVFEGVDSSELGIGGRHYSISLTNSSGRPTDLEEAIKKIVQIHGRLPGVVHTAYNMWDRIAQRYGMVTKLPRQGSVYGRQFVPLMGRIISIDSYRHCSSKDSLLSV